MSTSTERITARSLRAWPLPGGEGSKYERGQVLVVGGAASSPGAALLAGEAALRVGAGRLTLAVDEEVAARVAVALPESAVLPLGGEHDEYGRANAVLVGPGLDDADAALALLDSLVPQIADDAAVVLDAFALGVLPRSAIAGRLRGRLILTPNREEAELLLGRELDDDLAQLAEIAERYGAVVTSFGSVAAPDGRRWAIEVDSPHLGTSGSGDVLAGAIIGLCARGASPEQAAIWGTYLHHSAGRLAGRPAGAIGYLARDLFRALPAALYAV
ncbi:NAD(P)H-hydrate dehydratase [soil metagenome]